MRLNRTSEWKIITIWIAPELPLWNFERLDILCAWIGSPSEKLWPYEFLESFSCSILSVMIYYVPKLDIRVKSYDYLNSLRASVVKFWASRWIMSTNRTSVWKVMTIRISQELQLFNFERLDILFPRIGQRRLSRNQMVITCHTDVRFWRIIYRDARNLTTNALKKFIWS